MSLGHAIGIPFRRGGGAFSFDDAEAPTNLVATVYNDTRIDLTWQDNSANEEGYRIYYKEEGGEFAEHGTALSDAEAYSATGLIPNTLYYFYVVAYKGELESLVSNVVSSYTFQEITAGNILKYYSNNIDPSYISGTNLSGINDLSASANHGTTTGTGYPQYIANGFGTHKVIRFGGNSTAYFTFAEITTGRSFIWIGLENTAVSDALASLFGSTATYYHNARCTTINARGIFNFIAGGSKALYKWWRDKGRINGKPRSLHGADIPLTMSIVTGINSEAFRFNTLAMDRVVARIFGGDVILFKVFDVELTEEQVKSEILYWANQLGITIDVTGVPATCHLEGDSISYDISVQFVAGNLDKIADYGLNLLTRTAVGGSKIADVITRSDNDTIPNVNKTDIIINVGINDVNAYYGNSEAVQRAAFAGSLASLYTKLKTKQTFTHLFIGYVGDIYEPYVTVPANQYIIDAIPSHVYYNSEIDNFAAAHPTDVHVVNTKTVFDGATAANYLNDGYGLHPSVGAKVLLADLYANAIDGIYS